MIWAPICEQTGEQNFVRTSNELLGCRTALRELTLGRAINLAGLQRLSSCLPSGWRTIAAKTSAPY
jgi:hypothetical protein